MVLKVIANDRRTSSLWHDEFRGSRSDDFRQYKCINPFVIPLDKLQKALHEKLRALRTEEAFNDLLDFSVASKAFSGEILSLKPETEESHMMVDQDHMEEDVGSPNQELQYEYTLPSPSGITNCHPKKECQI
ncbi:hypothetical protein TNCV_739491 [Trichonephila clavipes]|nr:hypothetical protein TNCV_739491 [Trichonephila clavipes]